MEEILASIRKIISEDSGEPQPVPAPPQARAVVETHDADVLELTPGRREPPPVRRRLRAPSLRCTCACRAGSRRC